MSGLLACLPLQEKGEKGVEKSIKWKHSIYLEIGDEIMGILVRGRHASPIGNCIGVATVSEVWLSAMGEVLDSLILTR